MCSGSSIKSFGTSDLQFQHKSGISQVGIDAVTSRMYMERSWNVTLTSGMIQFMQLQYHSTLGWIDDCMYFPFLCKFKQNK